MFRYPVFVFLVFLVTEGGAAAEKTILSFKAGVAVATITPSEKMWMAGYAARDHPAEGKDQDLFVKALALEDQDGNRLVLLTSDLLALPRELSEAVYKECERRTGIARKQLMLTCSHTHCGPVMRGALPDMYPLTPAQVRQVEAYTDRLKDQMVETVVKALADLKPAALAIGKGTATFAVNRRMSTARGIVIGTNRPRPVDHDVPVLKVMGADGKLLAVVFGYACHNTTLSYYRWSGDYAGSAQQYLEAKHPGVAALFWIGCGGDANPSPRGSVALCRKHGLELAEAVETVLNGKMQTLSGGFASSYGLIDLPFDHLPTKEKLQNDLRSKNASEARRAVRLLKALERDGKLNDCYRYYPVQVWRIGRDLLWIALGGEVLVDYDLRLKRELAGKQAIWITGYANDVMAYIPSVPVLREGGYEVDTSMIYYGLPSRWSPAIEDRIIGKVHKEAGGNAP
jgi:hypothetical protein